MPAGQSRMSWLCSNSADGSPGPRSPARPATAGNLPAAGTSRRRSAPRRPGPPECHVQLRDLSTTSQSSFCAVRLGHQGTALPCSRSVATMVRTRCVFLVPGRPVSSRELPGPRGRPPVPPPLFGAPPPCAPTAQQRLRLLRGACRPGGVAPPAPAGRGNAAGAHGRRGGLKAVDAQHSTEVVHSSKLDSADFSQAFAYKGAYSSVGLCLRAATAPTAPSTTQCWALSIAWWPRPILDAPPRHLAQVLTQPKRFAERARRCPTECGSSGRRPGPASRPAKPSIRAGDGQERWPTLAPAAHHVLVDVQRVLCARLRLKNQMLDEGLVKGKSPCWEAAGLGGSSGAGPPGSAARPRTRAARRPPPGPRRRFFSTTAPSARVRARAPPSAASVICCCCLAQLAILLERAQFFLPGRAFFPGILARMAGENCLFGFALEKMLYGPFCTFFAWHDMIFA